MDTQPQVSAASFDEWRVEIPWRWRIAAMATVWAGAMMAVAFLCWTHPYGVYTGPPITIDLGGFNSRGDRRFLQGSPNYDTHKPLAGLHPYIYYIPQAHRYVVCEDVFHNDYANEADAKLGKLSGNLDRYIQVHPKIGRRGCWHIIGYL